MFKRFIKLFSFIFLSAIATFSFAANDVDHIIAIVNHEVITQNQLKQQIRLLYPNTETSTKLEKQVLKHLIDETLQLQLAKSLGLNVDDTIVDKTIRGIAQQHGLTMPQLLKKLSEMGINTSAYRGEIQKQIIINQLQQREVGNTIKITEQEITALMPMFAKQSSAISEYHLLDLLVPLPEHPNKNQIQSAKQQTLRLLNALHTGKNIKINDSNPEAPLSADLGWRKLNDIPQAFIPYLRGMKPAQVAGPILTSNGFHIIKLVELRGIEKLFSAHKTLVRQILIKPDAITKDTDVKSRLYDLRQQIIHGADFANLAAIHSQDIASASRGGSLGWITPGNLDPQFEQAMESLQPGQISQPFATSDGWHIIQVEQRRKFNDLKELWRDKARAIIYHKKFAEEIPVWLQKLRHNAYIKITGQVQN